jgi:hypothetical protein
MDVFRYFAYVDHHDMELAHTFTPPGLGPLLCLATGVLAPREPRGLVHVGRIDEAKAIFAKFHGNGDENDPLVTTQIAEV